MNPYQIMAFYAMMLVFDLIVIFATGYVVFLKGESGWWFLFCVILVLPGSNPKYIMKLAK